VSTLPDMTDLASLHQLGLAQCRTEGCTGVPIFSAMGPTYGKSARLNLISGTYAAFLHEPQIDVDSAVCLNCALDAVYALAGQSRAAELNRVAAQALRAAADVAEKVSVVFDQDSDDGWRNWMRERAAALAESKPCKVCGKPAVWIECPTGSWWAHVDHPSDEHDAEVEETR
jgi:hypothetical protein